MPETRPGIKFDENGVGFPCLNVKRREKTDWAKRAEELKNLCDKYRRNDGYYDCINPVSGGKDSHFQIYVMKEIYKMHPLLVTVSDWFTHTKAGEHNVRNICEVFDCDLLRFNSSPMTLKKMIRISFEEFLAPTWPIDLAIYSVPLKIAYQMKIPLIVYGENIAYEYGGPEARETYSAKDQIKNDVVKEIDWNWWFKKGITEKEIDYIKYPPKEILDSLEPIYLSYFYPWDGMKNYQIAKKLGFHDSNGEWNREGFIENYDQIDSIGYVIHAQLKYPKLGHQRATDVACYWIRNGYITREEGIKLVKENDHKFDPKSVEDFCNFVGYSEREFYEVVEKFYNKDIFEKTESGWKLKDPIWEQEKIR